MIERKGNLIAKVVSDTKAETLTPEVMKAVKDTASVITDEWLGYKSLKRFYDHTFVKHNEGECSNGRVYTNTIEDFWSLHKRGIVGIYHSTTRNTYKNMWMSLCSDIILVIILQEIDLIRFFVICGID